MSTHFRDEDYIEKDLRVGELVTYYDYGWVDGGHFLGRDENGWARIRTRSGAGCDDLHVLLNQVNLGETALQCCMVQPKHVRKLGERPRRPRDFSAPPRLTRLALGFSDASHITFLATDETCSSFDVIEDDEYVDEAPCEWVLTARDGFEIVTGESGERLVLDEDGEEVGTLPPGSRFWGRREDAVAYRAQMGLALAKAFVLASVLLINVSRTHEDV